MINDQEKLEAIQACTKHYGFVYILEELNATITIIEKGILSVPLDKDPEKAALSLYAERMKLEGAIAIRNAFITKMKAYKEMR